LIRLRRDSSPAEQQSEWKQRLTERWGVVPAGGDERKSTEELLKLSDEKLLRFWRDTRDREGVFDQRGWYRLLYRDFVRGRHLLDVGCGLALDTLTFAEQGATITCADLAVSNVELVERVATLLDVQSRVSVVHLDSLEWSGRFTGTFDAIFAQGSLHHAPQEVVGPEVRGIAEYLAPGGRWLQLAYPRARWKREGKPPFSRWGEKTDGPNTPWAEWYDAEKLLNLLAPFPFRLVFETEWHNHDFNWFDLVLDPSVADG
jgi:SAM-dependent methyltransferase